MNTTMKVTASRFQGEAAFVQHRRSAKRIEKAAFTAFVLPSTDTRWYFAAVASRRLGGAVQRNRAKRRLRAAFAKAVAEISAPHRVILYAKNPVLRTKFSDLVEHIGESICYTKQA
jgi:ribonuclease P protein component